jgi:hypothetical protein
METVSGIARVSELDSALKDRDRRRGSISANVSGLFISSERAKLVGGEQISMRCVNDRDRRIGDITLIVSDLSRSSKLNSKLDEEMHTVALVIVSDDPFVKLDETLDSSPIQLYSSSSCRSR